MEPKAEALAPEAPAEPRAITLSWASIIILVIFAFGIWIRFHDLQRMAYHHDESIHSYYSWRLYEKGPHSPEIKADPSFYDPTYHGPFLYHLQALTFFLFGDSDFTGRLPFALSGVLLLWVAYRFKFLLGQRTAILILLLAAISPVLTYFARFARNDTLVGAECIALIYCAIKYFQATDAKFKNRWFWGTAFFLALHYCTKENSYAHGAIYCSFLGFYALWRFLRAMGDAKKFRQVGHKVFVEHHAFTKLYVLYGWFSCFMFSFVYFDVKGLLPGKHHWLKWVIWWIPAFIVLAVLIALLWLLRKNFEGGEERAGRSVEGEVGPVGRALLVNYPVLVGIAIIVILYSVLFSTLGGNFGIKPGQGPLPAGGYDSGQGLYAGVYDYVRYWMEMHKTPRIPGPRTYYLPRLGLYETLSFLTLGIATIVYFIWGVRDSSGKKDRPWLFWPWRVFLLYYSFAALLIYSHLEEKVPWLLVHQALPLILLAGTFFGDLWERVSSKAVHVFAGIVFVVLAVWSLRGNIILNCYNNDNPKEIMVYTQTDRVVKYILDEIKQTTYLAAQGTGMPIMVKGSAQWPFTWYYRHHGTNFKVYVARPFAPVIITDESESLRMKAMLGDDYTVRTYEFRTHWTPNLNNPPDGLRLPQNKHLYYKRLWEYALYRRVWSPPGGFQINLYVKKDLVPTVLPPDIDLPEGFEQLPQRGKFVRSFGRPGKAQGMFLGPRGIDVAPDGSIYVLDSGNARVQKLDAQGQPLLSWGRPGKEAEQFSLEYYTGPCGLAVGPDGSVYVADTWNHRIQKFNSEGKFVRMWGGATSAFFGPRDVAVDKDGNVYVADTGNKRIQKFDPDGRFLRQWGAAGSLPGELDEPVGIAIGPDEMVYVIDTGNRRIQSFDPNGKFQRQVHLLAWDQDAVSAVEPYLAVDQEGRIYATDATLSVVHQLSPDGKRVTTWGTKGSGPGQFEEPTGIAISPSGEIYITDRKLSRVLIFEAR